MNNITNFQSDKRNTLSCLQERIADHMLNFFSRNLDELI